MAILFHTETFLSANLALLLYSLFVRKSSVSPVCHPRTDSIYLSHAEEEWKRSLRRGPSVR